jgi:hypothetical protein
MHYQEMVKKFFRKCYDIVDKDKSGSLDKVFADAVSICKISSKMSSKTIFFFM